MLKSAATGTPTKMPTVPYATISIVADQGPELVANPYEAPSAPSVPAITIMLRSLRASTL